MNEMKLVPFEIERITETAQQIPDGIRLVQAPAVWEEGKQGSGVVVAVLDTGCQTDHSDLQERIIGGYNFTEDDDGNPARYEDGNGHGTHVAGIIAAVDNGQGVAGVAPQADLLILKV